MKNPNASLLRLDEKGHKYFIARPKGRWNNRVMVFIHGMAGFAAYLVPKMTYFASRGYLCYAPDIMGHGERHEIDISGKFVADYVEDVSDFIERIVRDSCCGRIILVGHSMGGLIAAKIAEERDDISASVLITPAPPKGISLVPCGIFSITVSDVRGIARMVAFGERFVPSRTFLESMFADPAASREAIDQWESRRVSNESFFVVYQLGFSRFAVDSEKVDAPMLVIGAKKDKLVSHRVAGRISEYFGADYHRIETLGHMCPFEAGWEETAGVIDDWLKKKELYL